MHGMMCIYVLFPRVENKIFTGLFALFFFCSVGFLILLCQCSLPVPTLLLLPSSPPRAVLLPILPSHCVVYHGGGGGEGGGAWRCLGRRSRGGKRYRVTKMYFCSFVICNFLFPFFFIRATTSCLSMLNDFFPYPVYHPPTSTSPRHC